MRQPLHRQNPPEGNKFLLDNLKEVLKVRSVADIKRLTRDLGLEQRLLALEALVVELGRESGADADLVELVLDFGRQGRHGVEVRGRDFVVHEAFLVDGCELFGCGFEGGFEGFGAGVHGGDDYGEASVAVEAVSVSKVVLLRGWTGSVVGAWGLKCTVLVVAAEDCHFENRRRRRAVKGSSQRLQRRDYSRSRVQYMYM